MCIPAIIKICVRDIVAKLKQSRYDNHVLLSSQDNFCNISSNHKTPSAYIANKNKNSASNKNKVL